MLKSLTRVPTIQPLEIFSARLLGEIFRFPLLTELKTGFSQGRLVYPYFRVALKGAILEKVSLQPTPREVMNAWRNGATLIFQFMERIFPSVTQSVRALEARSGRHCHATAYLTPAENQAFPAHTDSHDALIVQVLGSKRWTIWDGIPDCIEMTSLDPYVKPSHDLILREGDCLYVPAGTIHRVRAEGQASYHVTIGVHDIPARAP